jgi:hypothetical protein
MQSAVYSEPCKDPLEKHVWVARQWTNQMIAVENGDIWSGLEEIYKSCRLLFTFLAKTFYFRD